MAKATAVRNIRDDHQKAFLKIFNSLCGRFNRWQVWQDLDTSNNGLRTWWLLTLTAPSRT